MSLVIVQWGSKILKFSLCHTPELFSLNVIHVKTSELYLSHGSSPSLLSSNKGCLLFQRQRSTSGWWFISGSLLTVMAVSEYHTGIHSYNVKQKERMVCHETPNTHNSLIRLLY